MRDVVYATAGSKFVPLSTAYAHCTNGLINSQPLIPPSRASGSVFELVRQGILEVTACGVSSRIFVKGGGKRDNCRVKGGRRL